MSRRCLSILLCALVVNGFGCQHSTIHPAASRNEPTPSDQEIHRAVHQTPTLPDLDARTAAALIASELHTQKLADTLTGIDRAMQVVTLNLANADTTEFKSTQAQCDGNEQPICTLDATQGALKNTGRPLDVAIQGEGFFKVKTSASVGDGFGYTRNGALFVNDNGQLVVGLKDDYRLQPPITIPPGATGITIRQDGQISYTMPGKNASTIAGQLQISQFVHPEGLQRHSGNIYLQTPASGRPTESNPGEHGAGETIQNFLEASNVDINRERLRLDFLRNWQNTILNAIDAESAPIRATARAGNE